MDNQLSRERRLELYYFMQLNRQLEERLVRLFRQNKIVGGVYSSLGQEAVSVGTAYALETQDWLAPMIRNIGTLLVKGFKPRDIFTQHMAKATSPTHGKDGTSHFGDLKTLHVVSPISMLGDLIPVMTGVGMAGRYLGQKIVAMTWIGDGGSSTGAFHEGLNLAAAQRAPLVLVLENNQWAYSTPVSRQVPLKNLADRALAYGIKNRIVDGNDVLAVYDTTKWAVDECRAGRGPILIEAKTMRMKGHAQHDPAEYVPKEMFEYWKARDPIARYEKYLTESALWDEKTKAEIDERIERELEEDQKFAEESPLPSPEIAAQGVYCDGCHAIEAEWQRPQAEVMPPAASAEAQWKVNDFGAAAAPHHAVHSQHGNTQHAAKPQHKPEHKPAHKPVHNAQPQSPTQASAPRPTPAQPPAARPAPAQPAAASPEKAPSQDITQATPLRVPFGRGPKDRSFEREQQQNQPAKPPEHRRRRRR